jgi:hypothetical protein
MNHGICSEYAWLILDNIQAERIASKEERVNTRSLISEET